MTLTPSRSWGLSNRLPVMTAVPVGWVINADRAVIRDGVFGGGGGGFVGEEGVTPAAGGVVDEDDPGTGEAPDGRLRRAGLAQSRALESVARRASVARPVLGRVTNPLSIWLRSSAWQAADVTQLPMQDNGPGRLVS